MKYKKKMMAPPTSLHTLAQIDLKTKILCDGSGEFLAPLKDVRFRTSVHIGSSARAIVASWQGGSPGSSAVLSRSNQLYTGVSARSGAGL